jgi:hypothetical protein
MMSSSSVAVFFCLSTLVSGGFSADDRAPVHYRGLKDLYQARVLDQLVGGPKRSDLFSLQALAGLRQIVRTERICDAAPLFAVRALLDKLLQAVHFVFPSVVFFEPIEQLRHGYRPFRLMWVERARVDI